MGPIVLFDKSFVEMLNVDEAALFDFLYLTNICPMFLTEVLADLEKETSEQRTREKIVADVARKTPYTFFHVAVGKKLISPDRLSNRVDIAYLYYLPFAMVFVSNDKLHKRVVRSD